MYVYGYNQLGSLDSRRMNECRRDEMSISFVRCSHQAPSKLVVFLHNLTPFQRDGLAAVLDPFEPFIPFLDHTFLIFKPSSN